MNVHYFNNKDKPKSDPEKNSFAVMVSHVSAHAEYYGLGYNLLAGHGVGGDTAMPFLRQSFAERTGKPGSVTDMKHAIEIVQRKRSFDPLSEMLAALPEWDGEKRLDSWLSVYAGVKGEGYVEQVGRKWLISAMARGYDPGCQADHCLVLQGRQGIGKTQLLRVLAGDFYVSMTGKKLGERDTKAELRGCWIGEFADLGVLPATEIGVIKAFITDSVDQYTPKYDREPTYAKRRCVFGITDNPNGSGWLKDSTGARRFWPVTCGWVDIDKLVRDRGQLLAEAKEAYHGGEDWWEIEDEHGLKEQQEALQSDDPWTDKVMEYVSKNSERIKITNVLEELRISPDKWDQRSMKRVADILGKAGFEKRKVRDREKKVGWWWVRK